MTDQSAFITRTSQFLPNDPVDNETMEDRLGLINDRPSRARKLVLRNNGIRTRYYAIDPATGRPNFTNAELAARAVEGLLGGDFAPDDIQCLAAATSMADQLMPGHASMVHGELGNPPCELVSTAGVCVSGMTALKYAYMNVLTGDCDNAVAVASESASRFARAENYTAEVAHKVEQLESRPELAFEKDFLRWMLSDGAGAMRIQPRPNPGERALRIEWLEILSFANEQNACMYAGARKEDDGRLTGWADVDAQTREQESFLATKQDVKQLNEHIMPYTGTHALNNLRQRRSIRPEEVDHFLPHYSSHYFRDRLYEAMKAADFDVPQERWFTNLSEKGNTGSASIYIMLDDLLCSGRVEPGQKVLCYIPESGRFSVAYLLLEVV